MRRLLAAALVVAFAAAVLPATAAAETGWPTGWWPRKLARHVFAGQLNVPTSGVRCIGLGKGRPSGVPSFRLYHRFVCSSTSLPYLYRVRATPGFDDGHGNWGYRLVIEQRISD